MSDLSAVPAGAVLDTFQKVIESKVIKEEMTSQKQIASLANSDGFKALQEVIDRYISLLQNIPIDPKTDSPESIGFRYLASRVAIEYLQEVRDLPDRQANLTQPADEKRE